MKLIANEDRKFKNGVYLMAFNYYVSGDLVDVRKILKINESFTVDYLDIGKKYWHDQGILVKDAKGSYKNPFGVHIKVLQ